jgi:hypothetical protein
MLRLDDDGRLWWRNRKLPESYIKFFPSRRMWAIWNGRWPGKEAFTTPSGKYGTYLSGGILGESHYAHRLIWKYVTGRWPRYEIDHRDQNGWNNWITNLRDVTRSVNNRNQALNLKRNNSTGHMGISKTKGGRFSPTYQDRDGKKRFVAARDTLQEAIDALDAERAKHGYTRRHARRVKLKQRRGAAIARGRRSSRMGEH